MKLKHLIPQILTVTEQAAIKSSYWRGQKNEFAADKAAVEAMRLALAHVDIDGKVVIGEGERDKAPMLYIGEKIGTKLGPRVDIAVDPLEGTTICAENKRNSFSVIAIAPENNLLKAPDVYMNKIAIGPNLPANLVDLDNTVHKNLSNLANAKRCEIKDLKVTVLDRPRHEELIAKILEAGARLNLISDGDILGAISTAYGKDRADLYIGIGGAPEGVLAAAAFLSLGGQMMGRLILTTQNEQERARKLGISDFNKKYTLNDLAQGEVIFALTGVTDGDLVQGVKFYKDHITTESMIIYSSTKTVDIQTKRHEC